MNAETSILKFCDLILKGGITSGVIYPRLVSGLAKKYQFKSVGGASAGAIAAAGAAAAEYQRRETGSSAGFDRLANLPEELKLPPPGSDRKENMLFLLFQPYKELKRHFAVLVSALNANSMSERFTSALVSFFREFIPVYWIAALIGALPGLLLFGVVIVSLFPNSLSQGLCHTAIALLTWTAAACLGFFLWRLFSRIGVAIAITFVCGYTAVLGGLIDFMHLWSWQAVVVTLASGLAFGIAVLGAAATTIKSAANSLVTWLPKNNFGFCSGLPTANKGPHLESLTEWLSHYFDDLAEKKEGPLTFGDLWEVKPTEFAKRDECRKSPSTRSLNLEVMTTAISQGIPYRLPFSNDLFCFDPVEWYELFPKRIVDWMVLHSRGPAFARPSEINKNADGGIPLSTQRRLYRLPHAADFPVVVAVRMSLSFPILLSAIPLYSIDWTLQFNIDAEKSNSAIRDEFEKVRKQFFAEAVDSPKWWAARSALDQIDLGRDIKLRKATRVWFSDGGIASNLPLHFFDSKLPSHPTFAVNLTSFHPDDPKFENRVELPDNNQGGIKTHWPERPKSPGVGPILSFLWDIIETMHSWRDTIQLPFPGYRDRIAQIAQKPEEGGLNLNMPVPHIDALADAGALAADEFINKFVNSDGWNNHRAIRLRTLLGLTEEFVLDLEAQYPGTQSPSYQDLLNNLPSYKFKNQAVMHQSMGDCLMTDLAFAATQLKSNANLSLTDDTFPHPTPDLRIVPRV